MSLVKCFCNFLANRLFSCLSYNLVLSLFLIVLLVHSWASWKKKKDRSASNKRRGKNCKKKKSDVLLIGLKFLSTFFCCSFKNLSVLLCTVVVVVRSVDFYVFLVYIQAKQIWVGKLIINLFYQLVFLNTNDTEYSRKWGLW